jgi:uncharacterized protein (DUF2345 family)
MLPEKICTRSISLGAEQAGHAPRTTAHDSRLRATQRVRHAQTLANPPCHALPLLLTLSSGSVAAVGGFNRYDLVTLLAESPAGKIEAGPPLDLTSAVRGSHGASGRSCPLVSFCISSSRSTRS